MWSLLLLSSSMSLFIMYSLRHSNSLKLSLSSFKASDNVGSVSAYGQGFVNSGGTYLFFFSRLLFLFWGIYISLHFVQCCGSEFFGDACKEPRPRSSLNMWCLNHSSKVKMIWHEIYIYKYITRTLAKYIVYSLCHRLWDVSVHESCFIVVQTVLEFILYRYSPV